MAVLKNGASSTATRMDQGKCSSGGAAGGAVVTSSVVVGATGGEVGRSGDKLSRGGSRGGSGGFSGGSPSSGLADSSSGGGLGGGTGLSLADLMAAEIRKVDQTCGGVPEAVVVCEEVVVGTIVAVAQVAAFASPVSPVSPVSPTSPAASPHLSSLAAARFLDVRRVVHFSDHVDVIETALPGGNFNDAGSGLRYTAPLRGYEKPRHGKAPHLSPEDKEALYAHRPDLRIVLRGRRRNRNNGGSRGRGTGDDGNSGFDGGRAYNSGHHGHVSSSAAGSVTLVAANQRVQPALLSEDDLRMHRAAEGGRSGLAGGGSGGKGEEDARAERRGVALECMRLVRPGDGDDQQGATVREREECVSRLRMLLEIYPWVVHVTQDRTGDTLLLQACRLGLGGFAEVCLSNGSINDPHPTYGMTGLQLAVQHGHTTVVELLLRHHQQNEGRERDGKEHSISGGDGSCHGTTRPLEPACVIVNQESGDGTFPIHTAARQGNVAVLQLLLLHGADGNVLDAASQTPLHVAADVGHCDCVACLLQHDDDGGGGGGGEGKGVGGIDSGGYDVDGGGLTEPFGSSVGDNVSLIERQDMHGNTALHLAARTGDPNIVRLLLQTAADPHAVSARGETPLDLALAHDHPAIVALVLEYAVDFVSADGSGGGGGFQCCLETGDCSRRGAPPCGQCQERVCTSCVVKCDGVCPMCRCRAPTRQNSPFSNAEQEEGTTQGQTYNMQVGEASETYSGEENDTEEALRGAQRTQGAQRANGNQSKHGDDVEVRPEQGEVQYAAGMGGATTATTAKVGKVYTALDGAEFTNRGEYRRYAYEHFYSLKNKAGGKHTKAPGTVDGQSFDLCDLEDCTVEVLDHMSQVQADRLTNCRVFLGPTEGSVFVRNCENCEFTVACRQLRTRDLTNCTFYLAAGTNPVIECSTGLIFRPFNGAYPNLRAHFAAAKLVLEDNHWRQVYDFNDGGKDGYDVPGPHFELVEGIDTEWRVENDAWPGVCENPVPVDSTARDEREQGGLQQMQTPPAATRSAAGGADRTPNTTAFASRINYLRAGSAGDGGGGGGSDSRSRSGVGRDNSGAMGGGERELGSSRQTRLPIYASPVEGPDADDLPG